MGDSTYTISISNLLTALTLFGAIVSVYISLVNKISVIESALKNIEYRISIIKEHIAQYESGISNIDNAIVRIDKSLDLHTQQYISDKDIALSHRHSLHELIQHRSTRYDTEVSKLEIELKKEISILNLDIKNNNKDRDKQLDDITGFLIKKLEFNNRRGDI